MPSFIHWNKISLAWVHDKKKLIIISSFVSVVILTVLFWVLFSKVWSVTPSSPKNDQAQVDSGLQPISREGIPVTNSTDYSKNSQTALNGVYSTKPMDSTPQSVFNNIQVQITTASVYEDWQKVITFGNQGLAVEGHSQDISMLTYISTAYMKLGNTAEYKATLMKLKTAYEASGGKDTQTYKDIVKALGS
ncbi:MAG: hypothetical protein ABIQ04_05050 [Candidatus Saccharimonadales bacterium]